jgi:hypothetical protein
VTLEHREHLDSIVQDPVDDSIAAFEHLADIIASELGHASPRHGQLRRPLRGGKQTLDPALRRDRIVGGDVGVDRFEIANRSIGPDKRLGRHLDRPANRARIRATTSAWGCTRPASASAIPSAIASSKRWRSASALRSSAMDWPAAWTLDPDMRAVYPFGSLAPTGPRTRRYPQNADAAGLAVRGQDAAMVQHAHLELDEVSPAPQLERRIAADLVFINANHEDFEFLAEHAGAQQHPPPSRPLSVTIASNPAPCDPTARRRPRSRLSQVGVGIPAHATRALISGTSSRGPEQELQSSQRLQPISPSRSAAGWSPVCPRSTSSLPCPRRTGLSQHGTHHPARARLAQVSSARSKNAKISYQACRVRGERLSCWISSPTCNLNG